MDNVITAVADAEQNHPGVCPQCAGETLWCALVGLGDEGVMDLGQFATCENCGDLFLCAFCPTRLSWDGMLIYRHLWGAHARA